MKKLIFATLAVIMLYGCKESYEPIQHIELGKISFGDVDTRVDSASEIDEFSVWASVSSIGSSDVSYEPILTNERVYRNPLDTNNWKYDNEQLWISNSMFYFLAFYPYNEGFEEVRIEEDGYGYTYYILDLSSDGAAYIDDMLVATKVVNTNDSSFNHNNPVELTFEHLLTKVNLKIRQDYKSDPDFDYYVSKITITGVRSGGMCYLLPGVDIIESYWDTTNANFITIEKEFDTPFKLIDRTATEKILTLDVWGEEGGLMLMPQTIASRAVKVRIDFYYDVNPDDESIGELNNIEGFIPATDLWQSSKVINYTLDIARQNEITFSQPTIDPWGAPQTGGTIIIK